MATAVQVNTFGIERRSRVLSGKPNGSVERCMHVHLVVWDSVANEVQQLHVDAVKASDQLRITGDFFLDIELESVGQVSVFRLNIHVIKQVMQGNLAAVLDYLRTAMKNKLQRVFKS